MHVTYARRDGFNVARQHIDLKTCGSPTAIGHAAVRLTKLRTTQHTHQAPDGVVMNGRGHTRRSYKTHHRKAVLWICIQQILLVMLWVGLGKFRQQPVIVAYKGLQALTRLR